MIAKTGFLARMRTPVVGGARLMRGRAKRRIVTGSGSTHNNGGIR